MAEFKIRQAGGVGWYTDWATAIAAAEAAHGGGLAEDVYILCYDSLTYNENIAQNLNLYSDSEYTVYIGGADGYLPVISGDDSHRGGAGWIWQNTHFVNDDTTTIETSDGLHYQKMQLINCIVENIHIPGGCCIRGDGAFYARNTQFVTTFGGTNYHWLDASSGNSFICDGCYFYSTDTSANSLGIDGTMGSFIFRGCVFYGAQTVIERNEYYAQIIEYCTFYNAIDSASYICCNYGSTSAGAEKRVGPLFKFRGNIFDGNGKGIAIQSKESRIESDYNVFNVATVVSLDNEGLTYNLAQWQANVRGQDANSLSEDPQLTNPGAGDFTPKSAYFGQTPVLPGTPTFLGETTRYDHMGTVGAVDPVGSYDDPTDPPTVVTNSGYTE